MSLAATVVLPEAMASNIAHVSKDTLETAAVLLVGVARTETRLRLLGRELHWIDPVDYDVRTFNRLSIPSGAYVRMLGRAADLETAVLFLHTHPGAIGTPQPSKWDKLVDESLSEMFRIRTGSEVYGSIVVSPSANSFTFTGRGIDATESFNVDRVFISGSRSGLVTSFDVPRAATTGTMFDRHIRAFGGEVQGVLASLHIGIVGCGGTGSAVAEQLVRLGVRSLTLVDDDDLSESNVTRVYGSTPADVGRPKTEVLAAHLRRIAPGLDVEERRDLVTRQVAARALTACDVLFGCTDDNAGRLVLSRIAAYYLVPLFDCGVLISSEMHSIIGIDGRVTVQTPGEACLTCRGRIDLARAAAEQLDPSERALREDEGYAPELGRIEPAVVTFTTAVASQAVTELLERFIGFGPEPVPTEVLLRIHERQMSTNRRLPLDGHFCHPQTGQLGRGDSEPFLGQLWGKT